MFVNITVHGLFIYQLVPSFHVYVIAPVAFNRKFAPLHMVPPVEVTVGSGLTVIWAVDVDVHVLLSIAVTVYVLILFTGVNVNDEPMFPFDQIKFIVFVADAVMVAGMPIHFVSLVVVIVGSGFTVIIVFAELEHPFISITDTE